MKLHDLGVAVGLNLSSLVVEHLGQLLDCLAAIWVVCNSCLVANSATAW